MVVKSTAKIYLKDKVSHLAERRHPWLFSGAIGRIEGNPGDGQIAALYTADKSFYAWGLYNSHSQIRVRLYSWQEAEILGEDFWYKRLQTAIDLRYELLKYSPQDSCRLINSEGDHLSGLTVDRYDQYLVIQFTSLALYERRELIIDYLIRKLQPRGIYLRTEKGIGESENLELSDGLYRGEEPENPLYIEEKGIKFLVSLQTGQKTGFYLDQSANRRAVAKYAQDRKVLDMFCYTGGFSITAAVAGAKEVLGIDASESALELARKNSDLNRQQKKVTYEKGDAFKRLTGFAEERRKFDLIILDPPKFTKSRASVTSALKGYISLNELAIRCLAHSGILVSCSCSGRISPEQFSEILRVSALRSNRNLKILEKRGASADHPINPNAPESEYLKCYICHIE